MRKKYIILLLLFLLQGCSSPVPSGEDYTEINVSGKPIQIPLKNVEPMTMEGKDYSFTISPLTSYKISATVAGKKFYSSGWQAKVSPVDLALAWGKLAEPEYDTYITYSQSDRWYFYEYKHGSPFTNPYVINHSSNNHVIPAADNILSAIKTIKKKERITLEGYLVHVHGRYQGGPFWWRSSQTRSDTGNGSCEVFYVTKIRVGNKIYE